MIGNDPEAAVHAAYTALAIGDVDGLIRAIGEDKLAKVRKARIALVRRLALQWRGSGEAPEVRALLDDWNVGSVDELAMANVGDLVGRGMGHLAVVRRTLRCKTLGYEIRGTDATVTFQIEWRGAAPERGPVRVAKLRASEAGWLVCPRVLSPWLLPGLENTVFEEPTSPK